MRVVSHLCLKWVGALMFAAMTIGVAVRLGSDKEISWSVPATCFLISSSALTLAFLGHRGSIPGSWPESKQLLAAQHVPLRILDLVYRAFSRWTKPVKGPEDGDSP